MANGTLQYCTLSRQTTKDVHCFHEGHRVVYAFTITNHCISTNYLYNCLRVFLTWGVCLYTISRMIWILVLIINIWNINGKMFCKYHFTKGGALLARLSWPYVSGTDIVRPFTMTTPACISNPNPLGVNSTHIADGCKFLAKHLWLFDKRLFSWIFPTVKHSEFSTQHVGPEKGKGSYDRKTQTAWFTEREVTVTDGLAEGLRDNPWCSLQNTKNFN